MDRQTGGAKMGRLLGEQMEDPRMKGWIDRRNERGTGGQTDRYWQATGMRVKQVDGLQVGGRVSG